MVQCIYSRRVREGFALLRLCLCIRQRYTIKLRHLLGLSSRLQPGKHHPQDLRHRNLLPASLFPCLWERDGAVTGGQRVSAPGPTARHGLLAAGVPPICPPLLTVSPAALSAPLPVIPSLGELLCGWICVRRSPRLAGGRRWEVLVRSSFHAEQQE